MSDKTGLLRPKPSNHGPTRAYGPSEFERLLGDSAAEPATHAMVALDLHPTGPSLQASSIDSPIGRKAKRQPDPLMTEAAPIVDASPPAVPEATAPTSKRPATSSTPDQRRRNRQTLFLCAGILTIAGVAVAFFAAPRQDRQRSDAPPHAAAGREARAAPRSMDDNVVSPKNPLEPKDERQDHPSIKSAGEGHTTVSAPDALVAGHYRDAMERYVALAQSHPDKPVYAVIARVLKRRLVKLCTTKEDGTCPETSR